MISAMHLSELGERLGTAVHGPDATFTQVVTDSRVVDASSLFIALRGERFDGHDFIPEVIERGCAAIVSEYAIDGTVPHLQVVDSRLALAQAGAINREKFKGSVIGITGSSGKTTTKNMLDAVLSNIAKTTVTQANFNNEIGVPQTLLALDHSDGFAVVEMGARHQGDIAYLGQFVRPNVAILLNAGLAHLGEFGSYEAIVEAKGEIYQCLAKAGTAVVNLDDPAAQTWLARLDPARVISYSMNGNEQADIQARDIVCEASQSRYRLSSAQVECDVTVPLPGQHNIANSLAVAAVLQGLKLPLTNLDSGLARMAQTGGRLAFDLLPNGTRVIDDSYNANPLSVRASLEVLALQSGRRIAVLGEMGELGSEAKALHLELARFAKTLPIQGYFLIGRFADDMAHELGTSAQAYSGKAELIAALSAKLEGAEAVLLKGSRSEAMEDVLVELKRHFS